MNDNEHILLHVTCKDILLCKKTEIEDDFSFVNILILYGKSYLYKWKMEKVHASVEIYVQYMTFKLDMLSNTNSEFIKDWVFKNEAFCTIFVIISI